MRTITLKNEHETKRFGVELGKSLEQGDVVALIGDLGTGKTALTKYIAQGMGIQDLITSPTFTIVQEYHSGKLPLYHFDVYRIGDLEEMFELGYEEYFYGQGVCVIEWADLIQELLPENVKTIEIQYGQREGERIYQCTF
ncbi:MAG: tRNA (adenosine(37)-N6)-threonylcarbamoyltransferase complex ATPase subunit type 1 TsaE [Firmicutes bacterium]|jgi:tRNA threonylcarbamoyladenosine biosynthesis protein TsaE|nr:tRNA (adenosine(37)-N6)-threonylcarbamoyltransferase complex ATPase subunit type 1 TsaE [Bacillota bacterium]